MDWEMLNFRSGKNVMSSQLQTCSSRKCPYPPPQGRSMKIPRGEGGAKAKQRGGNANQKGTFHGGGGNGYYLEPHNESVIRLLEKKLLLLIMISRCLNRFFKIHISNWLQLSNKKFSATEENNINVHLHNNIDFFELYWAQHVGKHYQ